MPTCIQCGSEDFNLLEGHYYCVVCSVQSQDIREEALELEPTDRSLLPGQLIEIKSTPKERKKKVVNYGRPWRTCEAFQFIIKEQVKSLIKLGVSRSIQDVVFKLWKAYLGLTGEAFCENPANSGIYKGNPKLIRSRDLYPGTTEHPLPKVVRLMRSRHLLQEPIEKFNQKLQMDSDDEAHVSDDNDDVDQSDEDMWTLAMATEMEAGHKTKMKRSSSIEIMTMDLTLSFIHLALLYTDNLYTPQDLTRYVNSGDLPYYGAAVLLPEDMKFTGPDIVMINRCPTITVELLLQNSGRLAYYLDIRELPQPSIHALTAKYMIRLNLPGVLLGPLKSFLASRDTGPDHVTLRTNSRRLPDCDLMAVANVVCLLQMVFGFHDDTLQYASEVGSKVKKVLKSDVFVWSDWFSWLELKAHSVQEQSKEFLHRLDQLKMRLQTRVAILTETGTQKIHKPKTIASLQNPIETLQKKMVVDNKRKTQSHQEFHNFTFLDDFSQLSLLADNGETECDKTQNMLETDFRKQSLDYILQPNVCIHRLNQIGKDVCLNDSEMDLSQSSLLSHDLASPQKRKSQTDQSERKRQKSAKKVERLVEKVHVLQEKLDSTRGAWKLNEHFDVNVGSLSYYRLILSCSYVLGCNPENLHTLIRSQRIK